MDSQFLIKDLSAEYLKSLKNKVKKAFNENDKNLDPNLIIEFRLNETLHDKNMTML